MTSYDPIVEMDLGRTARRCGRMAEMALLFDMTGNATVGILCLLMSHCRAGSQGRLEIAGSKVIASVLLSCH